MKTCTGCGKATDNLTDGRCADCITSDNGPSADRMHVARDQRWVQAEMERDQQDARDEEIWRA